MDPCAFSQIRLNQIRSNINPIRTGELHRVTPSPSPAASSGEISVTHSDPHSLPSKQTSKRPRDPSDDDGTRKQ